MSAIAGLIEPRGKRAECRDVQRMLDRLAHCGPDGAGIWCSEHVGLGHCMLQSTPESRHETLPLYQSKPALAITCDARIDNRNELMQACGISPAERDITDSELILAAYERWGECCVEKLIGDFAFAIWDGRKRQLFCARDPFGIRPFFYYHSGESFVFATQIKALFSMEQVPKSLNESRIGDLLLGVLEDRASTFFNGVLRLPPAHALTVRPEGLKLREYWRAEASPEIRRSSDAEYAEEFRSIFTEAVRCRLRSISPIGCMLSGGLDSSSIACMTRSQLRAEGRNTPLHTFSVAFSDVRTDERVYIDSVLESGGFVPHCFNGDDINPLTDLPTMLDHFDEVFHGAGVAIPRMIYQKACEAGARVVLDGLGGDEVVSSGAPHLGELLRNGSWHEFGQEISSISHNTNCDGRQLAREYVGPYFSELKNHAEWWTLAKAMLLLPQGLNDSVPRFANDYGLGPLVRKFNRRFMPRAKYNGGSSSPTGSILSDEFAASVGLQDRHQRLRGDRPRRWLPESEVHCHRMNLGHLWLSIEEFGRVAALYAVEPRYPQLDKRLVDFCLRLPSRQKLSQGWSRAIFRRAMDQVLPEKVRWRASKAKFLPPFAAALRKHGREALEETILHPRSSVAHYFNLPVLRDRYQRFLAGDDSAAIQVWRALNLIVWLEKSELPAPVALQPSGVCEAHV
jgi:asparagine synthase (glutamine-hydrolysing)